MSSAELGQTVARNRILYKALGIDCVAIKRMSTSYLVLPLAVERSRIFLEISREPEKVRIDNMWLILRSTAPHLYDDSRILCYNSQCVPGMA